MLSESEKLKNDGETDASQSGVIDFVTRRVRFCKTGSMQYISHLDLQRTLMRVMTRAKIPLWFTKGFNPHPKVVFAMPLSVGSESVCELMDVRLRDDASMSEAEMMAALNAQLTDELAVKEVYTPERKFSDIAYAVYRCVIHTTGADAQLTERINDTLSSGELKMIKRTKSGDKEVDILPQIHSAHASFDAVAGNILLDMTLSATMDRFLNPELVLTALKSKCGILQGDLMQEWYTILRTSILDSDEKVFE